MAQTGKKRLHKSNARYLIDDQADEGDDSETENATRREDAYYDPSQLARRNKKLDLADLEERYNKEGEEIDEDYLSDQDEEYSKLHEDVIVQSNLPSSKDPKIWQVKVKRNFEKIDRKMQCF